MTYLTLAALFLSCFATALSLFVWSAWRRSSIRNLSRSLSTLSESQESLNLQLRSVKVRLSALSKPRKGGRFASEDDKQDEDDKPTTSAAEWKRRTNIDLALGRIKP
jgi:hypothetical protein